MYIIASSFRVESSTAATSSTFLRRLHRYSERIYTRSPLYLATTCSSGNTFRKSQGRRRLLLLPQVVYNRAGKFSTSHVPLLLTSPKPLRSAASRFFNRLESWWNGPSRLQPAADDVVNETNPESDDTKEGAVLDHEDLQDWLEDRAMRTSILHQMVRKLERQHPLKEENGLHQSVYKAVICAKLAKEYLATVVKLLVSLLATWEGSLDSTMTPPSEHSLERNIRKILSVSTKQGFLQLQALQTELARLNGPAQDPDAERDLRQTRQLVDDVETMLFTLFDGFGKAGLAELVADDSSDSSAMESSDEQDDDSRKLNTSTGKIRGVYHLSPFTAVHEYRTFTLDTACDYPSPQDLLFGMVNHVIEELTRTTTGGTNTGLDRGWIMLDIMEELRLGLESLYHTTSAPTTLNDFDNNYGIQTIFSKERTTNIDCRASIAWTTFNASLIKVSVSLSLYGHQQRMNSPGKANRRQRTVKGRDTLLRLVLDPGERVRREQPPCRILSMLDVEKAWTELLGIASVCTDLSNTRARVIDMMRLIITTRRRFGWYCLAPDRGSPTSSILLEWRRAFAF